MNFPLPTSVTTPTQVSSFKSRQAMKQLVIAMQKLSLAHNLETVMAIVRVAARELMFADGASIVLRDQDQCFYADEDAIAPLWKGQRFPMQSCIGGWTMNHRQPCMIADIYKDERIPFAAYQHTFVKSLTMVPIQPMAPLGAIGVYWAEQQQPTTEAVDLLEALAGATALALENVQVYTELEQRVQRRTAELEATTARLRVEMLERQAAEVRMQRHALTDELTGLYNRRGFLLMAKQKLELAHSMNMSACLLFIDLDGLKQVNDNYGHESGDRLLIAAGQILQQTFRESDVIARLGGDEYAVFVPCCLQTEQMLERLQTNINTFNQTCGSCYQLAMSIGVAMSQVDKETSITQMIMQADTLMYAHKQSKRVVAG